MTGSSFESSSEKLVLSQSSPQGCVCLDSEINEPGHSVSKHALPPVAIQSVNMHYLLRSFGQ